MAFDFVWFVKNRFSPALEYVQIIHLPNTTMITLRKQEYIILLKEVCMRLLLPVLLLFLQSILMLFNLLLKLVLCFVIFGHVLVTPQLGRIGNLLLI